MSKTIRIVAGLALAAGLTAGLAACSKATEPPVDLGIKPQGVTPAATEVPTATPTEAPTEAAMVPLSTEALSAYEQLAYLLADGSTATPIELSTAGGANLVIDRAYLAKGDLQTDGDEDSILVLADLSGGETPILYVAPVINENGTLMSPGLIQLENGDSVGGLSVQGGQVVATVWKRGAGGTGWQASEVAYDVVGNKLVEATPPAAMPAPAPTPLPTEAPPPPPPTITLTIKPQETTPGSKVDFYVHAFDNPAITTIELYRNGEKVDEFVWTSPDPEGVPYVHHTFTWRSASEGNYEIKAVARDKWGGEGWTEVQKLKVKPAEQ
jgi:hypothetical protein